MPPAVGRVEYRFSEFGQTPRPILDSIARWGVENNSKIVTILRRQSTG
jgi:DNA-binding HxlR family transcriptional regulator